MFRELRSAHGSHPRDCDVFDTTRHSDQNTPPLQAQGEERAFSAPVVAGDVKSLPYVHKDVRAHLQNHT